jgi:hypothetical protein
LGLNIGGRPGPGGQRPQQQYQKIGDEMFSYGRQEFASSGYLISLLADYYL